MSDVLPKERKEKYIKSQGDHCPFCGNPDFEGGSLTVEGGSCSQEVSCLKCEGVWWDCYTLTDVVADSSMDPENVKPIKDEEPSPGGTT